MWLVRCFTRLLAVKHELYYVRLKGIGVFYLSTGSYPGY